ncbi:MAG TPA: hypothetical protein DEA78_02430 [Cyanobacteria bacterium UBA11159]|nr:hypothetical protein [Cyanobacteria bacterium UBA11159]
MWIAKSRFNKLFSIAKPDDPENAVNMINNRHRRSLDYRIHFEVFYSNPKSFVAIFKTAILALTGFQAAHLLQLI